MGKITLTGKGRRWVQGGHPWVYMDDIATGKGQPGELLPVEDPNRNLLGWGLFSSESRIALRMVTRSSEQPNRAFWFERVRRAVALRERLGLMAPDGACRLLSGDAEGIPGLIVDRYRDVLVLQCGTQSAERMRDFLVGLIVEAVDFEPAAVVDRSDISVRKHEGLEPRVETLSGTEPGTLWVREGEIEYAVDVFAGHKTGAYLDQRDNRMRAAELAKGGRVLDAFSYDGLFALHAANAGAERVVCIEQNKAACERLEQNAARNGVAERIEIVRADAMSDLRARAAGDDQFTLAVVDPPAFARNRREVAGAERGYVEVNRRAIALLESGGWLVSASCSYNIRADAFVGFLASASRLEGRELWLAELAGASADHPHWLQLPETHYLKCAFAHTN